MTGRTNAAVGGGEVETVTGTIEVGGSLGYFDGTIPKGVWGYIPPLTITVAKNSIVYFEPHDTSVELALEGGIEPVMAFGAPLTYCYFVTGDFGIYESGQ